MVKPVPVLQLNDFQQPSTLHPHFYVQLLKEHVEQYQFVKLPHRHDFYCLFLFNQGTGNHIIDFKEYTVKPGSVFFMSPSQVHTLQLSEDMDGYVVFFNPQFYLLNSTHKSLAHFPFFHYTAMPQLLLENGFKEVITAIFIQLYEEYKGKEWRKEEILQAYLHILLIKLTNLYSQTCKPIFSSRILQQIRQLEDLIEKHYLEHKSVEDYAEWMHLSVKQLYSICQTALQKSLSTLLHERLLLEAKRLLVHSDNTVAQIAAQLNYSDNSYFNRFFKRETGLTPEEFRKQYR